MSGNRPPLRPEPDGRGLASQPELVATLIRAAWDAAADLVPGLDLDAPTRLPEWTVRDVLVHLGSWDEHPTFASLLDDARHGRVHDVDDADARNATLVTAHHDAGPDEIVAALADARDRALQFLAGPEVDSVGLQFSQSAVGMLPVTGIIAASGYELAVHALDLLPPDRVPAELLDAGIAALTDLTAALAARRGLSATFGVLTPTGSWAGGSQDGNWTTIRLAGEVTGRDLRWPAVEAAAADILDASSGRRLAAQLLLSRAIRMHDVAGLLGLVPALEAVPGLPGGSALRATARTLSQTGQLVARLAGFANR